ncbi:MAG: SufD family Fe-S cluster assembly protein [Alphaproteobacteria bacterium]|nr:SufD family Fe-S cluster assembly protein [Alphaproteobacteria bacterium]
MSYLWEKFNIKTFPARPLVFADGEFQPELSDCDAAKLEINDNNIEIIVDSAGELPIHIIYVGEIIGDKVIKIKQSESRISNLESRIYLTAKLSNKLPAFLTFFIDSAGKNSKINAKIVIQNFSGLKLSIFADHLAENTGLFVQNRVLAHAGSETELYGLAKIVGDCPDCESDISFTAMCAPDAKITMSPNQRIVSIPKSAEHSASIYRGTQPQIQYLAAAGLTPDQIKTTLEKAFLELS